MYNFKHEFNDDCRYNTYYNYSEPIVSTTSTYIQLRNILLYILLFILVFLAGMFSLKTYQDFTQKINIHNKTSMLEFVRKKEHTHPQNELTQAITNSITKNLQKKQVIDKLNKEELRLIIKKVVLKIEKKPQTIKYTQK